MIIKYAHRLFPQPNQKFGRTSTALARSELFFGIIRDMMMMTWVLSVTHISLWLCRPMPYRTLGSVRKKFCPLKSRCAYCIFMNIGTAPDEFSDRWLPKIEFLPDLSFLHYVHLIDSDKTSQRYKWNFLFLFTLINYQQCRIQNLYSNWIRYLESSS